VSIREQSRKHEIDDIQAENTSHAIPRSKFSTVRNQPLTSKPGERGRRDKELLLEWVILMREQQKQQKAKVMAYFLELI